MSEIQTISLAVAAASVAAFVVNSILTSRRDERSKRIILSNNILDLLTTKQSTRDVSELLDFTWSDLDDFMNKYDSKHDIDKAALRISTLSHYDALGFLLKEGLVDPDPVYTIGGWYSIWLWVKFHDIIYGWRRRVFGRNYCENFEYLAYRMWGMMRAKDPGFVTDETQFPPGAFEEAFSASPP